MNDNDFQTVPSEEERRFLLAIQNLNVGANGRWFAITMAAISLWSGWTDYAMFFAIILGLACIIEQIPGSPGTFGRLVVYLASILVVLAMILRLAFPAWWL